MKRLLDLPEEFLPARADWFPDETKLLIWRIEPRWSFQAKGEPIREPNHSLWSLSILGGMPTKIVDNATEGLVSPDGSLITFTRTNPEQPTRSIWVVRSNGENPRPIHASNEPNQNHFKSIWSPDGQRLFYFHPRKGIESCDLRGEKLTIVRPSQENTIPVAMCLTPEGRLLFSMF